MSPTETETPAGEPVRRVPVSEPNLCGREKEYVLDCMESGWISSNGKYVTQFENTFAAYCGSPHAIAVANGTCALHLALLALDVGPGDEVIIPSLTYVATANAVRYVGATPIFIDSETITWNLDVRLLEKAITPRTKAIIPVHLYGHPCDMDELMAIAQKHDIPVVEDAAEAFGSNYRGKMAGTFGQIGTYSFFGNKTITTGEGGMVVTSDAELARKIRLFKGQGVSPTRQYYFEVVGYNYRMTNIQAAIGLAQLENATLFIEGKRRVARQYQERLHGVQGLQLPVEKSLTYNSFWMYSILVHEDFGASRDEVMAHLKKRGVETRPFFFPCHLLPAYQDAKVSLPVAEELSRQGINLPSSTKLTAEDIDYVVGCLLECKR